VAEVDPDLVILDKRGKLESVRYEAINAMLLNEFLKEHKKVEEQLTMIRQLKSEAAKQEATASELKKSVGVLTAQLQEQTLQIQKVSAQVQMREPLARVALSNP
jgi:O-acetylhomoserine/O-acetylserine sulfhydrylase-like pyridoxal-dependent enzyme